MTSKTAEYLAEQKRLAEAADEGPWFHHETVHADNYVTAGGGILTGTHVCGPTYEKANAAFIAAARESVPRLVAAVEAVARIHREVEIEPSGTICHECSFQLPNGSYFGKVTEYPCPTIRAIEAALGGAGE